MLILLAALLPAHALEVTVEGTCPGPVSVTVTGLTPGARVAMVSSPEAGVTEVPAGLCAGTVLGLSPDGLVLRMVGTDSDGDGDVVLAPMLPSPSCGLQVQAVELLSCEASPVVDLPGYTPVDTTMVAASAGDATGLWAIDPVAGTVVRIADPRRPLTGLAFGDDGTLYGIQGGGYTAGANPDYGDIVTVDLATGALGEVARTRQKETSLEWVDGLLVAADENSETVEVDPVTGAITPLPARVDGVGFGYALAYDGEVLWRVSDTGLYTVDEVGADTFVAEVTGTAGGWGGGATFHEGELWIAVDDGRGGTELLVVDTLTGAATPTGIRIPDPAVDSLASRTR